MTLTTDVRSPSWDVAGYALGDYRLGRVTLSGGFRYDYIRIPFEDELDPAADTTNSFHRLSPRGGVSVDLGSGASAYGSVGQSFRAPAVLELACADETAACPLPFALGDDPPLDPVISTTVRDRHAAGARPGDHHRSVYRTDVQDDISFIQSENAVFEGFFEQHRRYPPRRRGARRAGAAERGGVALRQLCLHPRHLSRPGRDLQRCAPTTISPGRPSRARTRSRWATSSRWCRRTR